MDIQNEELNKEDREKLEKVLSPLVKEVQNECIHQWKHYEGEDELFRCELCGLTKWVIKIPVQNEEKEYWKGKKNQLTEITPEQLEELEKDNKGKIIVIPTQP